MLQEKQFLFTNDEEGRALLLSTYDQHLEEISDSLGAAFKPYPLAEVEVKPMLKFKEAHWPKAYYKRAEVNNGTRGTILFNLRNVYEHPTFSLKTLAFHEGIPGHHFQLSIQGKQEDVPSFRRKLSFAAYVEGWALYAEQLAWEMGLYRDDDLGNLGRLQAEMCRAVRLVVDTGIHYKKWTREEGIEYMWDNTGKTKPEVITEVERYIAWPGQACAYKIGMMKILSLREKAKLQLGHRFNLKEFHHVILQHGAVPLDILEEIVDEYLESVQLKGQ